MSSPQYIPKRGDIVWIDFDPSAGHEQAGTRPGLVLSEYIFNKKIGLALVAPITNTVRGHGFEVKITAKTTSGVILCQQIKMTDYYERRLEFIEKAKKNVVDEALKKVRLVLA